MICPVSRSLNFGKELLLTSGVNVEVCRKVERHRERAVRQRSKYQLLMERLSCDSPACVCRDQSEPPQHNKSESLIARRCIIAATFHVQDDAPSRSVLLVACGMWRTLVFVKYTPRNFY